MKKNSVLMLTIFAVLAFGSTAAAQITITIPKIPKLGKPKKEQPPASTNTSQSTKTEASASDESAEDEKATPTPASSAEKLSARESYKLDEIVETQQTVDKYEPGKLIWFVPFEKYEWVLRAVSQTERNKFYEEEELTPKVRQMFETAFTNLASSIAKKLPLYTVKTQEYPVRNPAEERLMKARITNVANQKVFHIGLKQASWLIDKNELGIPLRRYKRGIIWARNPVADHQYCQAYEINIIQDYAGGGTYGASYAKFLGDELVGCPAGQ